MARHRLGHPGDGMRQKTKSLLRTSLRDGPSTGDSPGRVGPKGLLLLPESGQGELERLPPGVDTGVEDSVLDTVEDDGGDPGILPTDDEGDNGGSTAGEVASKLRPIYGFLALKLGERILEVLEKCGRLRDCDDDGCDIMAAIEELIAGVEDIEALIQALEGLMRDVDDERISDPKHVKSYLAYCLHLRRKGRMEAKGVFGGSNGGNDGSVGGDGSGCSGNGGCERGEGGCGSEGGCGDDGGCGDHDGGKDGDADCGGGVRNDDTGGGVRTSPCSCDDKVGAGEGKCPCVGIDRRKNLARLIGKWISENGT